MGRVVIARASAHSAARTLALLVTLAAAGCASPPHELECSALFDPGCYCRAPGSAIGPVVDTCSASTAGGSTCCMDDASGECWCHPVGECVQSGASSCSCGSVSPLAGTRVASCSARAPYVCCVDPGAAGGCVCLGGIADCARDEMVVSSCDVSAFEECGAGLRRVSSCRPPM